jgi:hypothetical protein
VEYLGVELGELFDTVGLLPADAPGEEYDDEDDEDDASSASGGYSSSRGVAGGRAERGAGDGEGGDSAAAMMFRPRRLRALQRRYEQLLRVSLQVGVARFWVALALRTFWGRFVCHWLRELGPGVRLFLYVTNARSPAPLNSATFSHAVSHPRLIICCLPNLILPQLCPTGPIMCCSHTRERAHTHTHTLTQTDTFTHTITATHVSRK